MKPLLYAFLLFPILLKAQAPTPQIIPLYTDSIPNNTGYEAPELIDGPKDAPAAYQQVSHPTITAYLPDSTNNHKTAVIIFPGGAYSFLAFKEEGSNIAQYLAQQGMATFVVKYRLPDDKMMRNKSIVPLQDAQQAIKLVRMHVTQWGLDSNKIGIMGFSAGGHLAATAGTHFNQSYIPNKENINLRPDFMILVYPVISMADKLTHAGSRDNLLGPSPSGEQISSFSNELQVDEHTSPTWLTHAGDDRLVPVDNSIIFYQALQKHKVPAEMHIYPKGDHGFVLRQAASEWMHPLFTWMQGMNLMPK